MIKSKEEIRREAEEMFWKRNGRDFEEHEITQIEKGEYIGGYLGGYTQCQEDMADKIKKQIYDFTIDLKESTSTYVKQNCEGAIFGLNRLLNSLNKQD